MKTRNQLDQCTALVTGVSRGVGRGVAIGLGEYGFTVYARLV
jgi:NAD(P)-dependent dehydrogenase (short-subunit alcohol dehydrogenase family)